MLFGDRLSGSFVLATNRFADQIDPAGQTCLIVAIPEKRLDVAFSDLVCRLLLEKKKKNITKLDKHLEILDEEKEHDLVAAFFLIDDPSLRTALRLVPAVLLQL